MGAVAPLRPTRRPRRPTAVTFLLEDLDFGGTQRQTLELAARLDKTRFLPRFVLLRRGTMALGAEAEALGIPCLPLTDGESFSPLRALPALWRYLAREKPPLLQLLTVAPNVWGRIFGRALRLPAVIACCRSLGAVRGQHERWLSPLAHVHIANAQAICDLLLRESGMDGERAVFIPNGVDTDYFSPPAAAHPAPACVCVARLVPVKNHALLLRAFARVLAQLPNAALTLVGDGDCLDALAALALSLGIQGRVAFRPGTTDVRPYLHQAQVFVLSSDFEGTSNAVLEAMACALPVVATRTGGNAEAVLHESTGLLTPTGDPDALSQALLRVLSNADERTAFGLAGRERTLRSYSLRRMVAAHEQLYSRCLDNASRVH